MIEIWEPRWHDRVVLVAAYKVAVGINTIKFTRGRLKGLIFKIHSDIIQKCPITTNGKIRCYAIPLETLGIKPDDK